MFKCAKMPACSKLASLDKSNGFYEGNGKGKSTNS